MRWVRLVVLWVVAVGLFADSACAQSSPKTESPTCGATVTEVLAHARQSLAKPDAESQRAALACLIEAVGILESQNMTASRNDGLHIISVPSNAVIVKEAK